MDKAEGLFLRSASGLVREVSTTKAAFFNIACSMGAGPMFALSYIAFYPMAKVGPWPLFPWMIIIAGCIFGIFIMCFLFLVTAMPRSGGDYIYSSRIMHPYLGFMEAWMLIWGMIAAIGYNAWGTTYGVSAALHSAFPLGLEATATWFAQKEVLLVLGIIAFLIAGGILILGSAKQVQTINSALGAFAVLMMIVTVLSVVGADPNALETNLAKYGGTSTAAVVQQAAEAGYGPGAIDPSLIIGMLMFGFWTYVGFTYSTFIAGELKGNVTRNTSIAMSASICAAAFASGFLSLPFLNLAGTDFVASWGYLFWNTGTAPLGNSAPYPTVLASLLRPELAALQILNAAGIIVVFNFLVLIAITVALTRAIFAMGMDRLLPSALAQVNPRTHSPVNATILVLALGFLYYLFQVFAWNPLTGLWVSTFLFFPAFLFPGLNCIFLPFRRPEIYDLLPASLRKKALLPLCTWFGIVWVAVVLPVYSYTSFLPLFVGIAPSVEFAINAGVIHLVVFFIVFTAVYLYARWYNTKRGIDLGLVFKSIPPS